MLSRECNGAAPAGWKTRDERLWFPTVKGVVVINPQQRDLRPPLVAIEGVTIDRAPLPVTPSLQLRPNQESLEIQYTALSWRRPQQVRFRYQLANLDHQWIEAGGRRTAYYSHLPPGEYTFKVIADNGEGVWNTEGQSLGVVVLPPFYRTWWFAIVVALGVAGVLWLGYQYRIRQLQRAHAAQSEFSRQLMESQERERKRIAAELHDGLGQSLAIIKNRALLSLSTPEDHARAIEQLREISEASAEVIEEAREIAHNLRPYQLDRLGLTKTIEGMSRKVAETHDLRLNLELEQIDGLFSPEAEINIFRIVQESLNNIVKHAAATEAAVLIKKNTHLVEIESQDNGKGFIPGAPPSAATTRRGFGLTGMAERARVLGGDYHLASLPGRGTTMRMTINLENGRP